MRTMTPERERELRCYAGPGTSCSREAQEIWDEVDRLRASLGEDPATLITLPKQPNVTDDGYALPGVDVQARIKGIPESDHDMLGRAVRDEWVKWAREQPNPKPSWLVPWDELSEPDKDVDRRIGRRLANIGRCRYVEV